MDELEELKKRKAKELYNKMSNKNQPVKITDDEFEEFVSNNEKVLVDLWAEWCAPCKRLTPILEEIAPEVDAAIGKLNVEENRKIATQYSVTAIPTMLLFKNRELVNRLQGLLPKEQIKEAIQKA